jgi:proteasome alpha subunit
MGGSADQITTALKERWTEGLALEAALQLAVELLAAAPVGAPAPNGAPASEPRTLTPAQLEVAVLDRDRPRRKFRRINGPRLAELLGVDDDSDDAAGDPE